MKFEVETNRVAETVTRAQELIREISNDRAQMFNAIEGMNNMWQGEAHEAFVAQCAADNEAMLKLVQQLTNITEKFDSAKKAYETCESKALDMVAALQV